MRERWCGDNNEQNLSIRSVSRKGLRGALHFFAKKSLLSGSRGYREKPHLDSNGILCPNQNMSDRKLSIPTHCRRWRMNAEAC